MGRGVAAALALAALGFTLREAPPPVRAESLPQRLLGPVSNLAAGWQWVRVRMALDAGQRDLAYARAELALELDPGATDAWSWLASNMAFDRASPYREPDPRQRQRWTETAIDLLRRGERCALRPAELAWQAGLVMVLVGDSEGELPWPGGAEGAWRAADRHFARANELDPGLSDAWAQRAALHGLRLGSAEVAPDAKVRLQAMREALSLLERGLPTARYPGPLHFERGLLLATLGDGPDASLWPGGRAELYRQAISAFGEAERAHHPLAHDAQHAAEVALEALGGD
jgi:tetratricopeptide (TPR) repeat protein